MIKIGVLTLLVMVYVQVMGQVAKDNNPVLEAYIASTDKYWMEGSFLSVRVCLNTDDNTNDLSEYIKCTHVVALGENIMHMLSGGYNGDYDLFGNYVLAKIIKSEAIPVNQKQYDEIQEFSINDHDILQFNRMNTDSLILENSSEMMFLDIVPLWKPNYQTRCIIYNIINNGYQLEFDHDLECIVGISYWDK